MGYNIRPMSFGEVLDRAFVVLRDHFWLIVGISAVAFIPLGVMGAFPRFQPGPQISVGCAIGLMIVALLLDPIMAFAIAAAVASVYLDKPMTVGRAYRLTISFLGRIVGTHLLFFLLVMLSSIALIVPGVYFGTCWVLLMPVMVVENRFGMAALRRSRELVYGTWWRTLGIVLVGLMITQLPADAVQFFWGHIPFLGPILNYATRAVTSTYMGVLIVVYYFDRRCPTEDFDLRLLAERIRSEAETATQPMPGTSSIA